MRCLKQTETYRVLDAGAAKHVVFADGRKPITYRKVDRKKPEYAEYEDGCASGPDYI